MVFLRGTFSVCLLLIIDLLCSFQAFSPNLKYVASVGFQHDMIVNIWNWKVWYCVTQQTYYSLWVPQTIFQVVKQWQGCVLWAVPKPVTPYFALGFSRSSKCARPIRFQKYFECLHQRNVPLWRKKFLKNVSLWSQSCNDAVSVVELFLLVICENVFVNKM